MISPHTYHLIRRHLWRYMLALVLVGAGFLLCLSIPQVLSSRPFLAFWPVVVLAAEFGGKGPGVLATVASALCADLILNPYYGGLNLHEWVGMTALGIFLAGGLAISVFIGEKLKIQSLQRLQAAAVAASEARYRSLFEAANVGKSVTLPTGEIQVNRAFCDMLGYGPEEMRGKTWQELTPPEEIGPINEQLAPLLRGEKDAIRFEKRYIHKNGSYVWTDVSVVVQRDAEGKPLHFITTVVDIAERKRAEQREHTRLQVLERAALGYPLSEILEVMVRSMEAENPAMVGSILLLDEEGRHLLYGAAPSLPESFSRAIHGAAIGPCAGSCGTAAFRGEQVIVSDIASDPLWADYRALILPHGFKACWSQPIFSAAGRVLGTFAMYYRTLRSPTPQDLDIINAAAHIAAIAIEHERDRQALTTAYQQLESKEARLKQTLDALEQSETKYRTMFESASDAVMLFDGEYFLDCNDATLRIFGCQSRAQFIGTHPAVWAPSGEDSQQLAKTQLDKALKEGSARFEAVRQRLNGSQFPAEIWLTRMEMDGKSMVLATVRDITERKQLETERQKFFLLAESSSEFIGMCDLDMNPHYVNPAGRRMVGLPNMAAACRVKVQDYYFPEDQRFIAEEFFPRVLREGHGDVEIRLRHFQTGEPIWMFYYLFSVRDASGTPVGWATVSRDISERRQAEATLRESETRFRTLFEQAAVGVAEIETATGRFIRINQCYCDIAGYTREEMFALDFQTITHPDDLQADLDNMRRIVAGEIREFTMDKRYFRQDRSIVWVSLTVSPMWLPGATPDHHIAIVEDISARIQAENALQQLNLELEQRVEQRTQELTVANTQLQELDKLKSLFIASMSHELRTPLNSIIGFTGIILQGMSGEINTEQRKQLGIVKNNARHLLALINDIIDVSKIESGAIELADEAFDLPALARETSQALATAAAGKHLTLSLQVPPVLAIRSDRRRLNQILINLLDNAIKFTDVGGVAIELTLNESRVMLSVRDSGIGIDKQHQVRLFQAFSQIAPPSGQVHQGTGLGLYLSQRLAHLLGGEITLTSATGVGSCFTLTLPYRRNPKP